MKEYELRKWYPSLPKDWGVGHKVVQVINNKWEPYVSKDEFKPGKIDRNEVENNPEFWEKVKEKNYEILSYGFPKNSPPRNRIDNYPIYSVKRLSDGEIFTVGDVINNACDPSSFKIKSINIEGDVFLKGDNKYQWQILYRAIKIKNPLFTTEDDVDIYEGDEYYYFTTDLNRITTYKIKRHFANHKYCGSGDSNSYKYFSTKEKAEKWIENNKPKYSKSEVMNIIDKSLHETTWIDDFNYYFIDLDKVKKLL